MNKKYRTQSKKIVGGDRGAGARENRGRKGYEGEERAGSGSSKRAGSGREMRNAIFLNSTMC